MELPHTFIQWKGTDVCMDVWCRCGAQWHVDGAFCYFLRCRDCGRVYELGTSVALRELPPDEARAAPPTSTLEGE